jgi:hypothetical protein
VQEDGDREWRVEPARQFVTLPDPGAGGQNRHRRNRTKQDRTRIPHRPDYISSGEDFSSKNQRNGREIGFEARRETKELRFSAASPGYFRRQEIFL